MAPHPGVLAAELNDQEHLEEQAYAGHQDHVFEPVMLAPCPDASQSAFREAFDRHLLAKAQDLGLKTSNGESVPERQISDVDHALLPRIEMVEVRADELMDELTSEEPNSNTLSAEDAEEFAP